MSVMVFVDNFTDPSIVANAYVSSADASYPVANAYNLERRRRTWRSAGFFSVVPGENTIVFRETVGVDLTATITAGDYTSDVLSAIKTALESVGSSVYTVTRDTATKRIKITSNGAGGGGIFQLMLTNPASLDFASLIGFSTGSDLTGALSYEADLLRIHSSEWLKWDLGIPTNPTGLIGVVDRNSTIQLGGSGVLRLEGNWTDDWSAPAFSKDINIYGNNINYIDSAGFYSGGLRYWRLYLEDVDNPYGYVELGAIALCGTPTITRGCPVFPLKATTADRSNVAFSEGGRTIVTRRDKYQGYQLNWAGLDKASFEELMLVWEKYGLHTSFFMALDPTGAFSTAVGAWCKLVKFESAPESNLDSPNNWSMGWQIREEL